MMIKPLVHTASRAAAFAASALTLLSLPQAAHANVAIDSGAELLFVLWDTSTHAAYTLDLGLKANDFWIYAQQDAGYSYPAFTLQTSDARFAAFKTLSPTIANERWAVLAVQSNPTSSTPGDNKLYTTLRQGPGDGTVNPNWQDLTGMPADGFLNATQRAGSRWYRDLNSLGGGDDATKNTHPSTANGSALHSAGSTRYFANNGTIYAKNNPGSEGSYFGGLYDLTNEVNKSSWFYYVTNAAAGGGVVTDEFDNLTSNGYWGLAFTSSNTYQLSFTQAAAQSAANSATTALGIQRVATTDFASGAGSARLLNFDGAVTAVPEPASWALFGLGLLGIAARARKRS